MKPIIENDKLRRGDKVLVFFNAPGIFCYLLEREGHLFFFTVMLGKGTSVRYWYAESDHEILAIRTVLNSIGFLEAPIFKRYEGDDSFRRIPGGKELLDNLAIYENDLAERIKAAEKEKKETDKKAKKDAKLSKKEESINQDPKSNVIDLRDQSKNSQISSEKPESDVKLEPDSVN